MTGISNYCLLIRHQLRFKRNKSEENIGTTYLGKNIILEKV
jgi:hypothetical protein